MVSDADILDVSCPSLAANSSAQAQGKDASQLCKSLCLSHSLRPKLCSNPFRSPLNSASYCAGNTSRMLWFVAHGNSHASVSRPRALALSEAASKLGSRILCRGFSVVASLPWLRRSDCVAPLDPHTPTCTTVKVTHSELKKESIAIYEALFLSHLWTH